MPIDPVSLLAYGALVGGGLSALGTGLSLGGKGTGDFERTGGPSDEEIAAMKAALLARRRQSAMTGARTAMQSAGGVLSRRGAGRSGAVGVVAGRVGADLGEQLGMADVEASELEARLRGQRRYEYEPGWSEQMAAFGGKLAGALGPAAMLAGRISPVATGAPTGSVAQNLGLSPTEMSGLEQGMDPMTGMNVIAARSPGEARQSMAFGGPMPTMESLPIGTFGEAPGMESGVTPWSPAASPASPLGEGYEQWGMPGVEAPSRGIAPAPALDEWGLADAFDVASGVAPWLRRRRRRPGRASIGDPVSYSGGI